MRIPAKVDYAIRALAELAAAGDGPDPGLAALLLGRADNDARRGRPALAADRLLAAARLSPPGSSRNALVLDAAEHGQVLFPSLNPGMRSWSAGSGCEQE